jgi:hypothetical protein
MSLIIINYVDGKKGIRSIQGINQIRQAKGKSIITPVRCAYKKGDIYE